MIGQKYLQNILSSFELDTFPRSLILVGDKGAGKHTYCNLIKERLESTSKIPIQLDIVDITNNINLEYIEEINVRVEPSIYIIDASKISIREQNVILKLVEEPLNNSYIIILCEFPSQLIPTILNRCQKYYFEDYSREELESFSKDEDLLSIFSTPGKLKEFQGIDLGPYRNLVLKILDKMGVASLPNALTITDKIAFKNEKDKLNLEIFQKVLSKECIEYLNKTNDLSYWEEVSNYLFKSHLPRVDQKILFDNFIVNLWEKSRNGAQIS